MPGDPGQRPQKRRGHEEGKPFAQFGPPVPDLGRRRPELTRNHQDKSDGGQIGQRVQNHGQWQRPGDQERPERRADKPVSDKFHAPEAAVCRFQTVMRNDRRQHGLCGVVAEHFGRPDEKGRKKEGAVEQRRRHAMLRSFAERERYPDCSTGQRKGCAPEDIHPEDQKAPVRSVRDDPRWNGKEEPRKTQRDRDQSDQQRIAGQKRGKPRPGHGRDAVGEIGQAAREDEAAEGSLPH